MALRWGVLSTAGIAREVIAANPGRFVAVAGRDRERTAAFATATGLRQTFAGYEAMLASDAIDAVYVALPNSMHAEWTVKALSAGKHVLCEKPLTNDPAEAARCFDTATTHGRLCAEGFMWRLHPQTVLARRLVAEGAIGRLTTIRAALRVTVGAGDIRRSPALAGGSLDDLGCYCVSAIRLFAGEPERVSADAVFDGAAFDGVDLRVAGLVRCAADVVGLFDAGLDLPRADELELIGTDGVLRLPDPWHCREARVDLIRKGVAERLPADPTGEHALTGTKADAYRLEFDAFEAAVAGDHDLPFGRTDAVAQAATLAALSRSAHTELPVVL